MGDLDYGKTRQLLLDLGWIDSGWFSNRTIYTLGGYQIVEHNCDWFISKSDNWSSSLYKIWVRDEEIIREFTDLIKKVMENMSNPDKCTLAEYWENTKNIQEFYNKYDTNHSDEWGDGDTEDDEFLEDL